MTAPSATSTKAVYPPGWRVTTPRQPRVVPPVPVSVRPPVDVTPGGYGVGGYGVNGYGK